MTPGHVQPVTGQRSCEILMGGTFDTAPLPFALLMVADSFLWFERREKARHVHFVSLTMWTGCPAFLLSLKSESPLGVAQTITAGRIIWTPGTSEQAQLSVQLEESVGSNWVSVGISDYRDALLGQSPALPGELMILWFWNGPYAQNEQHNLKTVATAGSDKRGTLENVYIYVRMLQSGYCLCVEQLWGRHCLYHTDMDQNCNSILSWFQVFLDSCPGNNPHSFHYDSAEFRPRDI